jgi:hypothetical protein
MHALKHTHTPTTTTITTKLFVQDRTVNKSIQWALDICRNMVPRRPPLRKICDCSGYIDFKHN